MKKFGLCAALVGALVFAMAPTAFADQTFDCGMGRTLSLTGANSLWPPNHKYHDYTARAVVNPMDMAADLVTAIPSDEPVVGPGSGGPNHANDANPFMAH